MTTKAAQLEGYLITEREMKPLEKLILEQYQEADRLISERLRTLYDKMQAGKVKPEDQYNWLIQYDRNIKLRKDITAIYTKHDQSAMKLTVQSSKIGMSNNYYRQFYMLEYQDSVSFSMIDPNLVNYAVSGQIEAWKALDTDRYLNSALWPPSGTMLDIFRKNRADTLRRIQAQINGGLQAGLSYAEISRNVSSAIGEMVGDTAKGQYANALRIVRTEGNRALNAGSFASNLTALDQGFNMKKMWDATLDGRTRPAHGSADGQERDPQERFNVGDEWLMYPGDSAGSAGNVINCRCTTVDLIGDKKPTLRRGKDPLTGKPKVIDYTTFNDWAKANGLKKNKYGQLLS